jgi:16S rRNA (uracil1498-N3)-methyltransferase
MRLSRLFVDKPLAVGQEIILPKESAHYLLNVLRLRVGREVNLFNGKGGEYVARLIAATKKKAKLQIDEYKNIERESPLPLILVQAISRPEHFNYTLQKSVELGVQRIVPVITERSPPLDQTKITKREQHWRKIIISACEQCGRNRLPQLEEVLPLHIWLAKKSQRGIVLSPLGEHCLSDALKRENTLSARVSVTVLIGAEGGLSEAEIQQAIQAGYLDIRLGSRILRTETAAVTVLAICQALAGDFDVEAKPLRFS